MKRTLASVPILLLALQFQPSPAYSAEEGRPTHRSQEISEKENIPVLIKHLPDWENKQKTAIFATSAAELETFIGERPVLKSIDFIPGTEAVLASYSAGKLVIIEFTTPQASADTDQRVIRHLDSAGTNPGFFYRRIGNYNVFLFDGNDEAAADALFDEVKYEKVVQWLGQDPTILRRAEREFIEGTMNLFISTVLLILTALGTSVVIGIITGLLFFLFRDHRRATLTAFSDFGGLTRLNIDELTPDINTEEYVKK